MGYLSHGTPTGGERHVEDYLPPLTAEQEASGRAAARLLALATTPAPGLGTVIGTTSWETHMSTEQALATARKLYVEMAARIKALEAQVTQYDLASDALQAECEELRATNLALQAEVEALTGAEREYLGF